MQKSKVFNTLLFCLLCNFAMGQMQDTSARKQSRHSRKMTSSDTFKFPKFKVKQKLTDFGLGRMDAVENTGIYEGKKTEVIIPDQLVANLATNNARQIFSRVAGLNIWENDGAGLQLNIGGRGLDPNRSSNFNVRQNGYDISADALGYPESYYTPPMEAVGKVQIVRGAASLQYGTQFGGLVNFILKKPVQDKRIEIIFRQSIGSFGFYNTFNSISGTLKKFSYYTFFQYKRMDGWRPNSELNSTTFYTHFNYQFTKNTSLGMDYTDMRYLAQQPGGLSDAMFKENPRQSNRERNWFDVNWHLLALHFNHTIDSSSEINIRVFGLLAHRYALGFRPNRVATIDNNSDRDLIKGDFKNYGIEIRYLNHYQIQKKDMVFLVGTRYYNGFNHSIQGIGSKGKDANYNFVNTSIGINNDYTFPNDNVSIFSENIFNISDKFSITPGLRLEYIHTRAKGHYNNIQFDLAGNIINTTRTEENRNDERKFAIAGLGLSYKPIKKLEVYSNVSQNYRSITFSDMRITNPSQVIDPNLKDEHGYSFDVGLRTKSTKLYTFDFSGFLLNYNNRIGEVQFYDANNRVLRLRTNIGRALMLGVESYIESDVIHLLQPKEKALSGIVFINMAFIHARYLSGMQTSIKGKTVEFVPLINVKSGLRLGYKNFKASLQFTYLSDQFTDATNAVEGGVSAVVGLIPAYSIMDAGLSYQWRRLKAELSLNNLSNNLYFSRRATGYPGPGILPGDGRALFFTLGYKI